MEVCTSNNAVSALYRAYDSKYKYIGTSQTGFWSQIGKSTRIYSHEGGTHCSTIGYRSDNYSIPCLQIIPITRALLQNASRKNVAIDWNGKCRCFWLWHCDSIRMVHRSLRTACSQYFLQDGVQSFHRNAHRRALVLDSYKCFIRVIGYSEFNNFYVSRQHFFLPCF